MKNVFIHFYLSSKELPIEINYLILLGLRYLCCVSSIKIANKFCYFHYLL